ncbi:hypothetical protein [Burkholderia ubonensis]|uniref:hypothetical protein n=1 Tax=Burkholderia ubonensis TaxID=101571 RepID=UPI0009B4B499|nr:hypothetical protein [Burkholderia ubonensis]
MRCYLSSVVPFILIATLTACATPSSRPKLVGGNRDAHGCYPSAGYSWCEATQRCERPWELAKENGFAVSAENFAQYCRSDSVK